MNPSSNRARLGSIAVSLGLFWLLLCGVSSTAWAAATEVKSANPDPGRRFAAAWRIRGEITAAGGAGGERKLREGDPVFLAVRVSAATTAEAELKTD